ncbi:LOW QUALITY PROTEIN: hypothetical protein PoB_003910800 [Plakobranchus ocellatus]|uniref:Uncharacterized protein n=1 Tax=Plakobranchus ocellatus TaxID=259542 RepID=A0AAV4B0I5_9GAST|nr:LOW QUALITY PROTEIN: hypothetical protein PoB_003910800 [Plakobranchus ocellatus]
MTGKKAKQKRTKRVIGRRDKARIERKNRKCGRCRTGLGREESPEDRTSRSTPATPPTCPPAPLLPPPSPDKRSTPKEIAFRLPSPLVSSTLATSPRGPPNTRARAARV